MRLSRAHITLLAIALASFAMIACNPAPAKEDQDKDWVNAENLVETSDRILAGRLLDQKTEQVDVPDSDTGVFVDVKDILYLQFQVTESFKGTADVDDTIWIGFDPAAKADLLSGNRTPQPPVIGETYVLFLKGRARPIPYPSDYGAVLWTGNGQPSLAKIDGDDLLFRSDVVYLDLLGERTILIPNAESAAAFTLTLPRLRELTD